MANITETALEAAVDTTRRHRFISGFCFKLSRAPKTVDPSPTSEEHIASLGTGQLLSILGTS